MNSKDSRRREKGKQRTDGTNSKMRDLKLTISMITMDVSGLSSPNEKAEIFRLVKKQDTTLLPTRNALQHKDKYVQNKRWKKIYHHQN